MWEDRAAPPPPPLEGLFLRGLLAARSSRICFQSMGFAERLSPSTGVLAGHQLTCGMKETEGNINAVRDNLIKVVKTPRPRRTQSNRMNSPEFPSLDHWWGLEHWLELDHWLGLDHWLELERWWELDHWSGLDH